LLENIFSYFPAVLNRYEYSTEDSFARHNYFLIIYKIRQRKHSSFKHKLKDICTAIYRGSTRCKTRGQYGKTWKLFHLISCNKTGDARSVQTVEIGVEAGGGVSWTCPALTCVMKIELSLYKIAFTAFKD
jgi:hypothetical protein